MSVSYTKFIISIRALIILFGIISCEENNKSITRMTPNDDENCSLVLIRVRTELQSVNEAEI